MQLTYLNTDNQLTKQKKASEKNSQKPSLPRHSGVCWISMNVYHLSGNRSIVGIQTVI